METYTHYTLATWKVKPGREQQFIEAWTNLGNVFTKLKNPPVEKGTLIQSLTEPTLFYSFGPWKKLEDIEAMRQNPEVQEALQKLRELCTEAAPGAYKVVKEIKL